MGSRRIGMIVTPLKTRKITSKDTDLYKILDHYITALPNKSIVAITSKIISITQGRMVPFEEAKKEKLITEEAQWYLNSSQNKYGVSLSITNNILVPSAGIDESNGNGFYILWPRDVQQVANEVREYLLKKFKINNVGVIVTDSKTTPLRWGVTALALAYSGFKPLKNYIGKKDIFGKKMEYTKMNIADNLACSAALVMGEGSEQTPLAIIEDAPVMFVQKNPTKQELKALLISKEEDLYGPLLNSVKWKKGKA